MEHPRNYMFPEDQIEELRGLCSKLSIAQEGNLHYILLEELILPEGTNPTKVDALLCPFSTADGYPSRLFFAVKIESPQYDGLNWNSTGVRILERNWNAYSWKINRPGLRLAQLVGGHLSAKKK